MSSIPQCLKSQRRSGLGHSKRIVLFLRPFLTHILFSAMFTFSDVFNGVKILFFFFWLTSTVKSGSHVVSEGCCQPFSVTDVYPVGASPW